MEATLLSLGLETKTGSFLRVIPGRTVTPVRKYVMVYLEAG